VLLEKIKCPFCDSTKNKSTKNWSYNKNTTKVNMIACECGKSFRFYKSSKSTWAIPKKK